MRLYLATCQHETNCFSKIATDLDSFRDSLLIRPSTGGIADVRRALNGVVGYGDWVAAAETAGIELALGPAAFAQPSAPASSLTWRTLRQAVLDDLIAAGPVDGILMALHGAQIAEDVEDCEADLIEAVRKITGPGPVIGVLLDLHGHVSPSMLAADAIIACLEYPHTDFSERALKLFEIVRQAISGGPRPFTVMARAPMLAMHHTTRSPMRDLVSSARSAEVGDTLAVSLMHGFPWSDCAKAGASAVVVANADRSKAATIAADFASRFLALRSQTRDEHLGVEAAIDAALASPGEGPAVIADASDNPGGGAASDSTWFLSALLARGVDKAGVAIVWDPQSVAAAQAAGPGSTVTLRLGGHSGPLSGRPIEMDARVLAVSDDVRQGGPFERAGRPQGGALVQVGEVLVVLSGRRQQCVSPDAFATFGVDPTRLRLLVVKSMQHFHAEFAPIARSIHYANGPGSLTFDLASLAYQRLPRPIWPLDPIPEPEDDPR